MRKNAKSRKLFVEQLEDRRMLAGGSIAGAYPVVPANLVAKSAMVTSLPTPKLTVIAGDQGKVLSKFGLGTPQNSHTYAQIVSGTSQFVVVPSGGTSLTSNIQRISICVDADGNASNGYEKVIGSAYPDYNSGLAIITANTSMWFGDKPVQAAIVADFGSWPSEGAVSTELAMVSGLKNLGGNAIPDEVISYSGVPATIHTVLTDMYQISQRWNANTYESVSAGDNVPKLAEFNGYGKGSSLTSITFSVTNPDNIKPGSLTLSGDKNWDNVADVSAFGSLVKTGSNAGLVTFNLPNDGVSGSADFWVSCVSASHAMAGNNTFSVAYTDKVTAISDSTGLPLKGVVRGGNGAGQIQEWVNNTTITYAVVEKPQMEVSDGTSFAGGYVPPKYVDFNTSIIAAVVTVQNTGTTAGNVTEIQFGAEQGNVTALNSYSLMAVSDAGVKTKVASGSIIQTPQGQVVDFIMSSSIAPTVTQRYEVNAVTTQALPSGGAQAVQLGFIPAAFHATMGGKSLDPFWDIFDLMGDDPFFVIGQSGGGMG